MRYQNYLNASSNPLWSNLEDADCEGQFAIGNYEEQTRENGLEIIFEPIVESSYLRSAIEKRNIRLVLAVSCQSTYEYEEIQIGLKEQESVQLDFDRFFGNVYLTMLAFVWSNEEEIPASELRGVYENSNISLPNGAILAVSNELQVTMQPKPKPLDVSFFELELAHELNPENFEVSLLGSERVVIRAGKEVYNQIEYNRGLGDTGEKLNLAAVYFPILVSTLYELRDDAGPHTDKAWYNGILMAYPSLSDVIEIGNFEPVAVAQEIFESPFLAVSDALDWEV